MVVYIHGEFLQHPKGRTTWIYHVWLRGLTILVILQTQHVFTPWIIRWGEWCSREYFHGIVGGIQYNSHESPYSRLVFTQHTIFPLRYKNVDDRIFVHPPKNAANFVRPNDSYNILAPPPWPINKVAKTPPKHPNCLPPPITGRPIYLAPFNGRPIWLAK